MPGTFGYTAVQIHEFVKAAKSLRVGQNWQFRSVGENAQMLAVDLDLMDAGFVDLKLFVSASDANQPERYTAALVLNGVRVRGIDFFPVAIRKGYKVRVPKGWHENRIDPNLPKSDDDQNRHLALLDFAPIGLSHFLRLIAQRWNIELPTEETLL